MPKCAPIPGNRWHVLLIFAAPPFAVSTLGRTRDWHEGALAATKAQGLREKLGGVCASHDCQGRISPFFVRKFGFNPE